MVRRMSHAIQALAAAMGESTPSWIWHHCRRGIGGVWSAEKGDQTLEPDKRGGPMIFCMGLDPGSMSPIVNFTYRDLWLVSPGMRDDTLVRSAHQFRVDGVRLPCRGAQCVSYVSTGDVTATQQALYTYWYLR